MMRASAPKNQPNPFYLARFFNIFICQTKEIHFMTCSVFSNSLASQNLFLKLLYHKSLSNKTLHLYTDKN